MQGFFSLFGIVTLKIHQYLFLSLLLRAEREMTNICQQPVAQGSKQQYRLLLLQCSAQSKEAASGLLGPAPNAVITSKYCEAQEKS